jgi:hypothetical protein
MTLTVVVHRATRIVAGNRATVQLSFSTIRLFAVTEPRSRLAADEERVERFCGLGVVSCEEQRSRTLAIPVLAQLCGATSVESGFTDPHMVDGAKPIRGFVSWFLLTKPTVSKRCN